VSYYPKNDKDYYFRPICSLAAFGNIVYGVENLSNKVVAFKFDYPQIKFSFVLGKPGQGPGDLMYPIAISIWGDDIAIKEASAFSFFGYKGDFQSKFKIFSNNKSFFFQDNKIYWLNPSIKQNHLIEVYLKDGKRISTIGNKSIIPKVITDDPIKIDSIYEGIIFPYGQSIYYLNSRFGYYCRYSLEGKVLAEGEISDTFGDRGTKVKKYNMAVYIDHRKKAGDAGYPKPLIFEAASLYKDDLYFLGSRYTPEGAGRTTLDLKIFNLASMSTRSDFVISKEGFCRIDSFIMLENKGAIFLLLSITEMGEGHFLELYEVAK
jgi:hypothetical protein